MANDNLKIWKQVSTTDPSKTKQFTKPGGFRGTAINQTYQTELATKVFGPMGLGWGVEVVEERYQEGAPCIVNDVPQEIREVIHIAKVRLWYHFPDEGNGEIFHYGSTPFIYGSKYGVKSDEEHAKKSLTDATSKALSMLGFAADIYSGDFDNPDYREEAAQAVALEKAEDKDAEAAKQAQEYNAWKAEHLKLVSGAMGGSELKALFTLISRKMARVDDQQGLRALNEGYKARVEELKAIKKESENA